MVGLMGGNKKNTRHNLISTKQIFKKTSRSQKIPEKTTTTRRT
jgi:hypothetical protein